MEMLPQIIQVLVVHLFNKYDQRRRNDDEQRLSWPIRLLQYIDR